MNEIKALNASLRAQILLWESHKFTEKNIQQFILSSRGFSSMTVCMLLKINGSSQKRGTPTTCYIQRCSTIINTPFAFLYFIFLLQQADALMPLVLQEYNDGAAKLRAFIASNLLTGLTTLGLQSMISLCIVYIIGINVGHWNFIELFDWWVVLYNEAAVP